MEKADITLKVWYKRWWGIGLIVLLGLFLAVSFAFGFYVLALSRQIRSGTNSFDIQLPQLTAAEMKKITGENNYWLGAADPKITIVEFGDFACPQCKNSFSKIREI